MRRVALAALAALVLAPTASAARFLARRRRRRDHLDERASLDALERGRPGAPLRLALPPPGMPVARIDLRATRGATSSCSGAHGLEPNRRHVYSFDEVGRITISTTGEFRTAPRPSDPQVIRFAVSGDADGSLDPKSGRPGFNRFQVYGRMAAERNHFNVNLGDTIYSDSEIAGVPPALTVAAKWASTGRTSATRICATSAATASTATGTTTSSSTTSPEPSTAPPCTAPA